MNSDSILARWATAGGHKCIGRWRCGVQV